MRIRSFRTSDIETIDKIWREHHSDSFTLPNRSNILTDIVATDDYGKLVAYGQVKLFAEAILVLDLNASKIKKTRALILLFQHAVSSAKINGNVDLQAFTKNPTYARLLEKHFDFELTTNPGELLIREG